MNDRRTAERRTTPIDQHSGNKYIRKIYDVFERGKFVHVDCYAICKACKPGSTAVEHAIKKLLYAGLRNKADRLQDLREAIDSIERAIEQELEDQTAEQAKQNDEFWSRLGEWGTHKPEPISIPLRWQEFAFHPIRFHREFESTGVASMPQNDHGTQSQATEIPQLPEWHDSIVRLGHWEAVPVFEDEGRKTIIGYSVRWSRPGTRGRYVYIQHYMAGPDHTLQWCENVATRVAAKFNEDRTYILRCPGFLRAVEADKRHMLGYDE